ncbi:cyclase family protein, partial [Burkholderia pseudomallei]|uniref:cyclase family protein n=1 Tax=Burkholderia pseudomallei TaxID=28450 RepID=UPI001414F7D6
LPAHTHLTHLQADHGIEIESGDMLVLRTGYAEAVVGMNGKPDADVLHQYGAALDGTDAELLQWITDSGIAAICADNYAVEAYPARERQGPRAMLPL